MPKAAAPVYLVPYYKQNEPLAVRVQATASAPLLLPPRRTAANYCLCAFRNAQGLQILGFLGPADDLGLILGLNHRDKSAPDALGKRRQLFAVRPKPDRARISSRGDRRRWAWDLAAAPSSLRSWRDRTSGGVVILLSDQKIAPRVDANSERPQFRHKGSGQQ